MAMAVDPIEMLRGQAADALFPGEGTLTVEGLRAPVTVTRDAAGVPIVEAANLEDLWFAQGLVTAGERLFQLDLALRAANGRLSELFGPLTFDADRFARTIGLHLAGAASLATWTDEDHAMHARFRDGVWAWLALAPNPPIEYQLLGTAPKLPEDPAAWAACLAYLAWALSNNLETELLRAQIRGRAGEGVMRTLVPPTSGRRALGSNAWVLAGSHTASGLPLLANDPHLLALQPGAWIPLDLRAPGYQARGVALVSTPGIALGATPHHAWSATNVTGDVQDLFVVRDHDVNGTRVESIVVLGEAEPRIYTVRETRHGPILDRLPLGDTASTYEDLDPFYALRWTGATETLRPTTSIRIANATDFESFRRAVLEVRCPGQNFVYADVDGHIGVQVTGRHPIRRHGDGSIPLPDHGWDAWISDDEMPWILDPPDGVIVSANDGLLTAGLTDHLLTVDFHEPHRALRIRELLDARDQHDVASFEAAQRDTVSLAARAAVPALLTRTPRGARRDAALDLLAAWDHDLTAGSQAAAIYEVWTEAIARRALGPRLGDELLRAYTVSAETWKAAVLPSLLRAANGWLDADLLGAALDDALTELGDPVPAWGDLHRLVLASPLAKIPGLERLFTAVDAPLGGDELTVAAAGMDGGVGRTAAVIASVRMVWDLADPGGGSFAMPSGVSGNPASPHWNDQQSRYRDGGPADPSKPATLSLTPP